MLASRSARAIRHATERENSEERRIELRHLDAYALRAKLERLLVVVGRQREVLAPDAERSGFLRVPDDEVVEARNRNAAVTTAVGKEGNPPRRASITSRVGTAGWLSQATSSPRNRKGLK